MNDPLRPMPMTAEQVADLVRRVREKDANIRASTPVGLHKKWQQYRDRWR